MIPTKCLSLCDTILWSVVSKLHWGPTEPAQREDRNIQFVDLLTKTEQWFENYLTTVASTATTDPHSQDSPCCTAIFLQYSTMNYTNTGPAFFSSADCSFFIFPLHLKEESEARVLSWLCGATSTTRCHQILHTASKRSRGSCFSCCFKGRGLKTLGPQQCPPWQKWQGKWCLYTCHVFIHKAEYDLSFLCSVQKKCRKKKN